MEFPDVWIFHSNRTSTYDKLLIAVGKTSCAAKKLIWNGRQRHNKISYFQDKTTTCSILSVQFFVVVPVNPHLAGVGFPEFLAGDDLEEAEQLATVRQVREQVVHLEMSRRMRGMRMRMMRMMIMG